MTNSQFQYTPPDSGDANEQDELNTALDIERLLLASLMTAPECAVLATQVRADFFNGLHAEVARVILDLATKHGIAQVNMVQDELRAKGQYDADRGAYVMQLSNALLDPDTLMPIPTTHAPMWARRIAENAQKRDTEAEVLRYGAAVMRGDTDALATHTARLEAIAAYVPSENGKKKKRDHFLTIDDMRRTPIPYIINQRIKEASTCMLIADTGAGKTVNGLDWALTCALAGVGGTGYTALGDEVRGGHILYVAGEGQDGLEERVYMWMAYHNVDAEGIDRIRHHFHYWDQAVPLLDGVAMDKIMHMLSTDIPEDEQLQLAFFDTLNTCLEGAESENDSITIAAAIRAASRIKDEYGAAVVIMHHTGKDGKPRGSSAITQNVDTIILLNRENGGDMVVMSCLKQRDGVKFATFSFDLVLTHLTEDANSPVLMIPVRTDKASYYKPESIKEEKLAPDSKEAKVLSVFATDRVSATYGDIENATGITANLIRPIKKLLGYGYLVKKDDKAKIYTVTEKGRKLLSTIKPLSNGYHDSDDSANYQLSSLSPPFRGDSDDSGWGASTDTSETSYQVASAAPKFDTPHSEPTHQPDVTSPPMFTPPVAKHVTPLEYKRPPVVRPPAPDAWQADPQYDIRGQRCPECDNPQRKWHWDDDRNRWICLACGSPDLAAKGA